MQINQTSGLFKFVYNSVAKITCNRSFILPQWVLVESGLSHTLTYKNEVPVKVPVNWHLVNA